MNPPVDPAILKGVSRSFYLSLRLLPAPMRDAASLGYLLARTSDTLADHAGIPAGLRIGALRQFRDWIDGNGRCEDWPETLVAGVSHPQERLLLQQAGALIAALRRMPEAQARLLREVVGIIISGQCLDLERFGGADADRPQVLPDEAALDDYTWRVAGCVGEFWTRLASLTLGEGFASMPVERLVPLAIAYGKGLQLVNILRDLPKDLAEGRCYLPVDDARDRDALLREHRKQLAVARRCIGQGLEYVGHLKSRRLKLASGLPARLAGETLDLLDGIRWEALERGVKIKRRRVYLAVLQLAVH